MLHEDSNCIQFKEVHIRIAVYKKNIYLFQKNERIIKIGITWTAINSFY